MRSPWTYFTIGPAGGDENSPPRALGRTDPDGSRYNAQTLNGQSQWVDSEFLSRYHLRGTNEQPYFMISDTRAVEIVEAWVSSGRLPRFPDEPRAEERS